MISDFIEEMKKENSNLDYDKIIKVLKQKYSDEKFLDDLNNEEKSVFKKIESLIKREKSKKSNLDNYSFSDEDSSLEKLHKIESINNLIMEEIKDLIQVTNSLNKKFDDLNNNVKLLEDRVEHNTNKIDKLNSKNKKHEERVDVLGQNLRNFLKIYDKDRSRLKKTLYSDFEYLKDLIQNKKN